MEKYRYDYGVFLLNKNIELVSRRHSSEGAWLAVDRAFFRSVTAHGGCRNQARGYAAHVAQPKNVVVDARSAR